jgi:hypothetical protein
MKKAEVKKSRATVPLSRPSGKAVISVEEWGAKTWCVCWCYDGEDGEDDNGVVGVVGVGIAGGYKDEEVDDNGVDGLLNSDVAREADDGGGIVHAVVLVMVKT